MSFGVEDEKKRGPKIPVWLKKESLHSGVRGLRRRSLLRWLLTLRVLALYGPLTSYGIALAMKEKEGYDFPRQRIRPYLGALEEEGFVGRLKPRTKRLEVKFFAQPVAVSFLYYSRLLNKSQVLDLLDRQKSFVYLFRKIGLSGKVKRIVEEQLSFRSLELMVCVHSPRRITNGGRAYARDVYDHLVESRSRDTEMMVLYLLLPEVMRNRTYAERLRKILTKEPRLASLLQSTVSIFRKQLDGLRELAPSLEKAIEFAVQITGSQEVRESLKRAVKTSAEPPTILSDLERTALPQIEQRKK